MISDLEVFERAVKGPLMSEQDFDLNLFIPHLKKIVKEYGFHYDPENPVPCDDALADWMFQAAVDLVEQVGFFCKDTSRVIHFTREEILRAVRDASGTCRVGEGKDARVFSMRSPEDGKVPWQHVGSGIVATCEEYMTGLVGSYAAISQANSISISALDRLYGLPVIAGSPLELYAAIRGVRIGREALRQAGRPGLPILNLISTSAAAVTTLAASAPQFGLRPSDGWLVGSTAEMKIDFSAMNKTAYLLNSGANIGAETSPILGGYCGGPEGTAVASTAYILMGLLVQKGNYQLTFPVHFRYGCSTPRNVLWTVSISCQAASRNIPMPVIWLGYIAAGPATAMYFYESAAYLLAAVVSGAPGVQTPHPAKATLIDGITPVEARFGVDTAIAASKFSRAQANELVKRLLDKYESQLEHAPAGSRFQDCCDPLTGRPGAEYQRLIDQIKNELTNFGLNYKD